jgi:hypothetical protein
MLDSSLDDPPRRPLIVIDGFLLRAMPRVIMSEVLTRLGVSCDAGTIERAVTAWDAGTGHHIRRPDVSGEDAYREKVVTSLGYEPPLEESPPLDGFPEAFQTHIKEAAMPTYLRCLHHPGRLGPRTPQELLPILDEEVNGVRLVERNPVTAYALMSSLDRQRWRSSERSQQLEQLARMHARFSDHADAFALIDVLNSAR